MFDNLVTSDNQWAVEEFAHVELKDGRLNWRCQALATVLAQQPDMPINQACEDWADTKAAYRFFANEKVTPERILAPHQQRTVSRMSQHSLVLAVQDTTFFNYTHHPHSEELGAIGNKKQKQQGFGMHSTLAVTPTGMPLGLLTQAFFTRPVDEPSHQPNDLHKRPIEEKEAIAGCKHLSRRLPCLQRGWMSSLSVTAKPTSTKCSLWRRTRKRIC